MNLTADVVAKIFAGTVTTWDDAAITALNPDAELSGAITVVHRSDDSGTSKNFQDYLSQNRPGRVDLRGLQHVAGGRGPGRERHLRCRPDHPGRDRHHRLRGRVGRR